MSWLQQVLQRLLPCPWQDCAARWGCRCGKKKKKMTEKSSTTTTTVQQAPQAAAAQQALTQVATPTAQEQQWMEAIRALSQRQLPYLEGRARELPEELVRKLGPLAAAYYAQTQERLASPMQIPYEDVYPQQFNLLKESIAQEMARRGFAIGQGSSGLEFEKLGRAGIDLAIKTAQERVQNRLMNEQLRQEALDRAGMLWQSAGGMSQQARAELADYLTHGQQLSENIRNRQIGAAQTNVGATQGLGMTTTNEMQRMPNTSSSIWGSVGRLAGNVASMIPGPQSPILMAANMVGQSAFPQQSGSNPYLDAWRTKQFVPPTAYGAQGYHGAGYAQYPALYQSLYHGG